VSLGGPGRGGAVPEPGGRRRTWSLAGGLQDPARAGGGPRHLGEGFRLAAGGPRLGGRAGGGGGPDGGRGAEGGNRGGTSEGGNPGGTGSGGVLSGRAPGLEGGQSLGHVA